jgi:uncharacterized protein YndB with AHSA1/START domain/DNA-binding transcriptional ArsR family regulator
MDPVFRALADPTRRGLLDELFREDGQTLSALERRLTMSRFGVMKHLKLLEEAGLITTRRQGREKLHYLNAVPIRLIHDRWAGKYAQPWISLRNPVQPGPEESAMRKVFEIYIKTTPERLWEAMTDSAMRAKYNFGVGVTSDWSPGSSYRSFHPLSPDPLVEGENLEVDPPRRLVQSFRARWDDAVRAAGTSRVTWEVEPAADACRLTVIHDELAGGAGPELYGSWPVILSALKTFLETGLELAAPGPRGTLADKIARLRQAQADELLSAAGQAPDSGQAIELLQRAVDRDPGNVQARYELGVALSRTADYAAAVRELRTVLGLEEDLPEGWRELGVALSRSGQLTAAEEAFRRSLELDEDQPETWSNLGGLRRRMARSPGPGTDAPFDWAMLREARVAYGHASKLFSNDTYALVNVARVDLLLSAQEPASRPAILARLGKLEHLARFEAYPDAPARRDPWKAFDLADTLLLTGRTEDGLAELRAAIELVDPLDRAATLTSVIGPLQDFLRAGVLAEPAAGGVRAAIELCTQALGPGRAGPA